MNINLCPACRCEKYLLYPHPLYRRCCECNSLYQFTGIDTINDYYNDRTPNFTHQAGSYRIYLNIMRKYIDLKAYDLIDIGSGDGTFLDIAKTYVRQVKGTDISQIAMKILESKDYLTNGQLINMSPKIVTAFQVIEHVQDPRIFIKDLQINNSDWLILTSPATDSPTAMRCHSTGEWRSLSPSHHLCLFSRKGLEILINDCDLTIIHYEYTLSACNGLMDSIWKNIIQYFKWPIKKLIGRRDAFPKYYGKNSFIALIKKSI